MMLRRLLSRFTSKAAERRIAELEADVEALHAGHPVEIEELRRRCRKLEDDLQGAYEQISHLRGYEAMARKDFEWDHRPQPEGPWEPKEAFH